MYRPPITELNEALRAAAPVISANIYNLFVREQDMLKPEPERTALVIARFNKAQKLYQRVWNNGHTAAAYALFYRIDDREHLYSPAFARANLEMGENFKQYIQTIGRTPTADDVQKFFSDLRDKLQAINPRSLQNEAELQIAAHYFYQLPIADLATNVEANIDGWFFGQRQEIIKLDDRAFYQVADVDAAYRVGTIYGPGPDHNWGVNAAWALGVVCSNIPIRVISELNMRNIQRSHPNPHEVLNPSAFTLEIAIAIKMNYGLSIANGVVALTPPPPSRLLDYRTSGLPGDGPLPTKQQEIDIFRQCVLARELHGILFSHDHADLCNHIHAICVSANNAAKLDLAAALDLLGKGESLQPILNHLSLREHKALNIMLSEPQFATPDYERLKIAAKNANVNSMIGYINRSLLIRDDGDMRRWIRGICNGDDRIIKDHLVQALNFMGQTNLLNLKTTLKALSLGVYEGLKQLDMPAQLRQEILAAEMDRQRELDPRQPMLTAFQQGRVEAPSVSERASTISKTSTTADDAFSPRKRLEPPK